MFDEDRHEFLTEYEVANSYIAEVIYRLSTTTTDEGFVPADYADLDTRHLGTIYEGLLEHEFAVAPEAQAAVAENGGEVWRSAEEVSVAEAVETVGKGELYVVNDDGERKATGAYYTPDYVVKYIVEETVGPLLADIEAEIAEMDMEPGTQEYVVAFWERVTDLKILDPAMGSGHFLTKATGYLAEAMMEQVRELETGRLFDEEQVRREISRECIYGVDVNGMAVELAKLSMWLETLAADQPLAFLDHHLKTGNSLVGSDITDVLSRDEDESGQVTLAYDFAQTRQRALDHVMDLTGELLAIDNETLEDIHSMEELYDDIRADPLYQRLFAMATVHTAGQFGLDVPGDTTERMARAIEDDAAWADIEATDWFRTAQAMAAEEDFFHWELEFPAVFFDSDGERLASAGFDAVIGNPPYVSNWELTASDEDLPDSIERIYPEITYGHWDLYVPFTYRAIELTRPSGFQAFITPNSIDTEKYGKKLREYLIQECTLEMLVRFKDFSVFNDVDRQYLISVVNNSDSGSGECDMIEFEEKEFVKTGTVDPGNFLDYSNSTFRLDVLEEDRSIKSKVESDAVRLGSLCCVNPGVVAHSASDSPLEFKKDDVIDTEFHEGWKKYITGGDIDRYSTEWDGTYMDYTSKRDHFHRPKFPELFESPKIMFSGISGESSMISSCYDENGYYTNHNVLHAALWEGAIRDDHHSSQDYEIDGSAEKYDLKYIAALVNSKLVNYYFQRFLATGTLQGSYSAMYPEDIRKLPVQQIDFDHQANSPDISDLSLPENISDGHQIDQETTIEDALSALTVEMIEYNEAYNDLNLNLLDYLGTYTNGPTLEELGYQPESGLANSVLADTEADSEFVKLRVTAVRVERDGNRLQVLAVPYVKPPDEDAEEYETNSHGYATLDPVPAMEFVGLDKAQADLIETFVPHAVTEEVSYRDNATATISLLDRLENLTLPKLDDVANDIERYMDARERAAELNEQIERTDELIDEIVYELYGLTDEEVEIVEEAVGN